MSIALQIPLTNAVYDRLTADVDIVARIGTYGTPAAPAVLARNPVGDAVDGVYVIVRAPFISTPRDTKTNEGVQLSVDIGVYGPTRLDADQADDAYNDVDEVADMVRAQFGRAASRLAVSGWETIVMTVAGPIEAPSDDTMAGRIVTVGLTLRQADTFLQ